MILLFISISIILIFLLKMNIHILCMLLELVSQLAYLFSDLIIKRAKLLIFVLQGSGRAVTLLLVSSPDDNKP